MCMYAMSQTGTRDLAAGVDDIEAPLRNPSTSCTSTEHHNNHASRINQACLSSPPSSSLHLARRFASAWCSLRFPSPRAPDIRRIFVTFAPLPHFIAPAAPHRAQRLFELAARFYSTANRAVDLISVQSILKHPLRPSAAPKHHNWRQHEGE